MRLRRQKEVQKENDFYMQLLQQALPPEQQMLHRQEREAEEGETQEHTGVQKLQSSHGRMGSSFLFPLSKLCMNTSLYTPKV